MVTRRPRLESSAPSELAVRPLPRDDTTPPVTKTYFVGWELERSGPRSRGSASRPTDAHVNTRIAGGRAGTRSTACRGPVSHQVHQQRHEQRRGGGGPRDTAVV